MAMATVVVSILLAALFLFAASIKLLGVKQSLAGCCRSGPSPATYGHRTV